MAGRGAPEQRGHVQSPCCCCCCCCCVGRGGRGGGLQPSAVFLLGTLALTSAATALLAAAIMTDRWEEIRFDPEAVKAVARKHNNASRLNGGEELSFSSPPPLSAGAVYHSLTWLFGGLAVIVTITRGPTTPEALPLLKTLPSVPDVSVPPVTTVAKVTTEHIDAVTEVGWISEVPPIDEDEVTSPVSVTSEWTQLLEKATRVKRRTLGSFGHKKRRDGIIFLVPMHGGIWTLCVSVSEEEHNKLEEKGFPEPRCRNYLSLETAGRTEEARTNWQHRMQNLSISCALVCLIILGSSALVGAFGVLQHQISAVLVTGVMYLLAATFATFTLTIMHFKRRSKKGESECVVPLVDGGAVGSVVADSAPLDYAAARIFSNGWSLDLGWAGVVLCVMASALWILLSKIMRYSPLSFPTS